MVVEPYSCESVKTMSQAFGVSTATVSRYLQSTGKGNISINGFCMRSMNILWSHVARLTLQTRDTILNHILDILQIFHRLIIIFKQLRIFSNGKKFRPKQDVESTSIDVIAS